MELWNHNLVMYLRAISEPWGDYASDYCGIIPNYLGMGAQSTSCKDKWQRNGGQHRVIWLLVTCTVLIGLTNQIAEASKKQGYVIHVQYQLSSWIVELLLSWTWRSNPCEWYCCYCCFCQPSCSYICCEDLEYLTSEVSWRLCNNAEESRGKRRWVFHNSETVGVAWLPRLGD